MCDVFDQAVRIFVGVEKGAEVGTLLGGTERRRRTVRPKYSYAACTPPSARDSEGNGLRVRNDYSTSRISTGHVDEINLGKKQKVCLGVHTGGRAGLFSGEGSQRAGRLCSVAMIEPKQAT